MRKHISETRAPHWRDLDQKKRASMITVGDLFANAVWDFARFVRVSEALGVSPGAVLTAWIDQSKAGFDGWDHGNHRTQRRRTG